MAAYWEDGVMREITVFTHRRPEDTSAALARLAAAAADAGVTLRLDEKETRKHGLQEGPGLTVSAPVKDDVELCVVLGGDGTILGALQRYAGTGVPVFAVNFGEIGFLATVEPEEIEEGIARALDGDFELRQLPGIVLDVPGGEADARSGEAGIRGGDSEDARGRQAEDPEEERAETAGTSRGGAGSGGARRTAFNDIAIHRKVGERIAQIAYALDGEEVGSVRCDGLVVATPAGSTGYNLANGGPVMAWGVEGFVVSFIAPHSLAARTLVVAPRDRLTIHNRSREPLDVAVDGRPATEIPAGGSIDARFVDAVGTIAQLPGSSFYRRLREKFGRLAS
jgi:NAD+ kinase